MGNYLHKNNGQRCDSDNNAHSLNNGNAGRCDFSNNGRSDTFNHTFKSKGMSITQLVLKRNFGPYALKKDSSHCVNQDLGTDWDVANNHINRVGTILTGNSHYLAPVNDKNKGKSSHKNSAAVFCTSNSSKQVTNQTEQVNDITSYPDKYALDVFVLATGLGCMKANNAIPS